MRPTYLASVQTEEQRGDTAGGGGQKRSVATRDRHTGRHGRTGFHTWLIRRTPLEPDRDMKLNFSHCSGFPAFTGNALKHTRNTKVE